MRVSLGTRKRGAGLEPDAVRQAQAAINSVVGARDYGGDNVHSVVVRLLAKAPRGGLKRERVYAGSFAEHLSVDGILTEYDDARRVVETSAAVLGSASSPMYGVDLARLSKDVLSARRRLPLRIPLDDLELDNQLAFVKYDEKRRRRLRRPLTTRLIGVRCYCSQELEPLLSNEYRVLAEVLANSLCQQEFKTPGYSEIYFNVAGTLAEAQRMGRAIENWHENAYLVIDPKQYVKASASRREQLAIEGLAGAMRHLAAVDGLHRPSINKAIAALRRDGQRAELHGPAAENATHQARVVFHYLPADPCSAQFQAVVTNKATGKQQRHQLGRHSAFGWECRFSKVSLTKTCVRIDAAKGARADAYLRKSKRRIEFALTD